MSECHISVAIPYTDHLFCNINGHFFDTAVKLLVSSLVFDPALLPTDEASLSWYGNKQVHDLVEFYGNEATIESEGNIHLHLLLTVMGYTPSGRYSKGP